MKLIGVLGGMGPLATVHFMQRLVQLVSASRDQDHIPTIVINIPQIPDRSNNIIGIGSSPLPKLLGIIDIINTLPIDAVVIPCNTAHHWHEQLSTRCKVPILHIGQSCLAAFITNNERVWVLATRGTLASGFYQRLIQESGRGIFEQHLENVQELVDRCITDVKGNQLINAAASLECVLDLAHAIGITTVILGCTELPIAAQAIPLPKVRVIDSTLELARTTIEFATSARRSSLPIQSDLSENSIAEGN